MNFINTILEGDAHEVLKTLPSESIDCIITSPPYYKLRDYKNEKQIGQEKTEEEYIDKLVEVFDECKRILKKEGSCWVVLADSYNDNKSLSLIPERFAIKMIEDDSSDDYELNNDAPNWVKKELERINYKEQSNNTIEQCHTKTQKKQENTSENIQRSGEMTIGKSIESD